MFIDIILQTFLQEFSSGFFKGWDLSRIKKDYVAMKKTRIKENAWNVHLHPL